MSSKFCFTITTGRSGTTFLTNLLKANMDDAVVHHERLGFQSFGKNTPDASHFTLFNSVGNVAEVESFWNQKFARDRQVPNEWYIETSHFLAKAGLMENLNKLKPHVDEVHIILQYRDTFKTLWSFVNRFDFFNLGFTWLFALDVRYPNVIVNSKPFMQHGMFGHALWYIIEMRCRAEYYRQLYADDPKIHFHSIDLEDLVQQQGALSLLLRLTGQDMTKCNIPAKTNETKREYMGTREREMCLMLVNRFQFDPVTISKDFIKQGQRLEGHSL